MEQTRETEVRCPPSAVFPPVLLDLFCLPASCQQLLSSGRRGPRLGDSPAILNPIHLRVVPGSAGRLWTAAG